MASEIHYLELEHNQIKYEVEVELFANRTDESFSHEFGIQKEYGIEIDYVEVLTVHDSDGWEIESKEVIEAIKKLVDHEDFDHCLDNFEFED